MKNQLNFQHNNHQNDQSTHGVLTDYRDLWSWNLNAGESQELIAPHGSNGIIVGHVLATDSGHATNHDSHGISIKFDGLVHAMAGFASHQGGGEMPYHANTDDHGVQGSGMLCVDSVTR